MLIVTYRDVHMYLLSHCLYHWKPPNKCVWAMNCNHFPSGIKGIICSGCNLYINITSFIICVLNYKPGVRVWFVYVCRLLMYDSLKSLMWTMTGLDKMVTWLVLRALITNHTQDCHSPPSTAPWHFRFFCIINIY